MQSYWQSQDVIYVSGHGDVIRGPEEIRGHYGDGFGQGTLKFHDLNIDLVGEDRHGLKVAVVTGKWQLSASGKVQSQGALDLVVKKMPEGWKIILDHSWVPNNTAKK